jgi:hypothetical protein
VGKLTERDSLEDLGVHGRKILDWILKEVGSECVDGIHLAQDSDRWRAVVNTVMNLRVHKTLGIP